MSATRDERKPVGDKSDEQEIAITEDHGGVLEKTSDHGSQQVGAECCEGIRRVPETLGEHEIRDEDR